jgi:hypothetical protein
VIAYAIITLLSVYPNLIVVPYHRFVTSKYREQGRSAYARTIEDIIGFTALFFIAVNLLNFIFFLFEISQYAVIVFGAPPSMENDFHTAFLVVSFNTTLGYIVFKIRAKIAQYYSGRFKNVFISNKAQKEM